jgi:type I restriction-modification system DNA methylase subunit
MSISSTIKSIQDIMRKDVGADGDAQRLSQLVWMLFLKIFDDRESEWELLDDDYARLEKLKKNGFLQVPEDEAKSRKIFLIGMT